MACRCPERLARRQRARLTLPSTYGPHAFNLSEFGCIPAPRGDNEPVDVQGGLHSDRRPHRSDTCLPLWFELWFHTIQYNDTNQVVSPHAAALHPALAGGWLAPGAHTLLHAPPAVKAQPV